MFLVLACQAWPGYLPFAMAAYKKEVDNMAENEYICLACGSYYMSTSSATHDCADKNCPKCDSSNVMKLNVTELFGFSGRSG